MVPQWEHLATETTHQLLGTSLFHYYLATFSPHSKSLKLHHVAFGVPSHQGGCSTLTSQQPLGPSVVAQLRRAVDERRAGVRDRFHADLLVVGKATGNKLQGQAVVAHNTLHKVLEMGGDAGFRCKGA